MDINYYKKRINNAKKHKQILEKKSNELSRYRLISFGAILLFLILYFIKSYFLFMLITLISFVIFLFLIFVHSKTIKKIGYYLMLIETLDEYLARYDNSWINFPEIGEE
ncbi:MAG TPA: TMEM208 family protein, partial [Acholeplasmataceae bacterium]|nr:TMEM208 family protein [Acholeplasmataceae bacterium]